MSITTIRAGTSYIVTQIISFTLTHELLQSYRSSVGNKLEVMERPLKHAWLDDVIW